MAMLPCSTVTLWLSRLVLRWSGIKPCRGDAREQAALDVHPSWR